MTVHETSISLYKCCGKARGGRGVRGHGRGLALKEAVLFFFFPGRQGGEGHPRQQEPHESNFTSCQVRGSSENRARGRLGAPPPQKYRLSGWGAGEG